jgi:hypothetical protein
MCAPDEHDDQLTFQVWTNLKQPMPIWRKARLVISNNFTKLRARKGCCGNYDQPGC